MVDKVLRDDGYTDPLPGGFLLDVVQASGGKFIEASSSGHRIEFPKKVGRTSSASEDEGPTVARPGDVTPPPPGSAATGTLPWVRPVNADTARRRRKEPPNGAGVGWARTGKGRG
ncbi:unnamed protein product [Arctogadus glacialis]